MWQVERAVGECTGFLALGAVCRVLGFYVDQAVATLCGSDEDLWWRSIRLNCLLRARPCS
jgi:hypothetical protein